jgi:shingomyelin synthase
VLRRIFLLVGLHYYYRAITMCLTVLPKPNEEYICEPRLNVTTAAETAQRVLKLLSGMGLSINGKHVYCGDYIYSGHTMTLIMGYLVIKECKFASKFAIRNGYVEFVVGQNFLLHFMYLGRVDNAVTH